MVDVALLILRVGIAVLLIPLHGWARLVRAYDHLVFGEPWTFVAYVESLGFSSPLLFALLSTGAESVAPALIAVGVLTRMAALLLATNMTVAVISEAAQGQPFELPAVYLIGAVVLAIAGPGSYRLRLMLGRQARSVRRDAWRR